MPTAPPLKQRLFEMASLAAGLGAAFLVINYLHFQYIPVSVILYACLWDMALATLLVLGGYLLFRRKSSPLISTEIALTTIAANLLIALYSVMGPTVIDRSLSIYIAEKIDHRGGAVAEDAMEPIILTEFMQEYRVADVRMTEQVTSGTVRIADGCIRLTPRGQRLAAFTRFYRKTFLPQKRLVAGEITAQLTDPYRDTPVLVPFECPDAAQMDQQP